MYEYGECRKWPPRLVSRINELAAQQKVAITKKAAREIAALGLGLDREDVRELLVRLTEEDFASRIVSWQTDEWMYVFKPRMVRATMYVKIILRAECVVISFHEDVEEIA